MVTELLPLFHFVIPMDISTDKEVPHLSQEYYKARKSYNLFAGLLFLWGLVGIDIINIPTPTPSNIMNLNFKLKSPDALPYVLIVVLLFYAYRVSIEWYQSDVDRRKLNQSKVDFYISHILAVTSIFIYLLQANINKQIFSADLFSAIFSFLGSVSTVIYVVFAIKDMLSRQR